MRAVIQRVKESSVSVNNGIAGKIGKGFLVLLGIAGDDGVNESGVETGRKKTSLAALISLGFSGGMVPCPDALILLLLAIAINRITFGLLILVAFSFGLAFVLITIGIFMVTAQPFLERFTGSNVLRVLPALSCSIIIGIGLFMVIKSVLVLI